MKIPTIILGAKGRMGQALLSCATQHQNLEIVQGLDEGDDLEAILPKAQVLIDFTVAEASAKVATACQKAGVALVMGTTGQDDASREKIFQSARAIPVVFAPNFSVGVNTLFWLTRKACEILGPDFDLEVVEMHHRHKKDAPSGTARRLGEILASVRQLQYETHINHGREGLVGARTKDEIGMHALRGGDVVGDHTVIYAADGERIELTHKASSRDTFANGALRAAAWVAGRQPGLYDMMDVLGLE
jgi:4-hydroxy-tetrahydrodipicolinate reductase